MDKAQSAPRGENGAMFPPPPEQYVRQWEMKDLYKTQSILDQNYHAKAKVTRGETFIKRKLALWVELGELVNEWIELFKYWSNKKLEREKALVEYVDGLHFILSLGTDLNVPTEHNIVIKFANPIDHIFTLSVVIANIAGVQSYYDALCLYRGLGDHFGFTQEEIERAYHEKNKVNMERADHILDGMIGE